MNINLARAACLPRGLNALLMFFSLFLFGDPTSHAVISGSTGPIFTTFSQNGRGLLIRHSSSDRSRDVAMATNFTAKIGEIGLLTYIRRLGIPKRSCISQFRFQSVQCDDLTT